MPTPYSITKSGDTTCINTNAGSFILENKLFQKYWQTALPQKESFQYEFGSHLARAAIPDSFQARSEQEDPQPYNQHLNATIRDWVKHQGINPRQYTSSTEVSKLWEIATPALKDALTESQLLWYFSSEGVDRLTAFEHHARFGSAREFFGNPFMGGYSLDETTIAAAKAKRQGEILEQPHIIGIAIYRNTQDRMPDGMDHIRLLEQLGTVDQQPIKRILDELLHHPGTQKVTVATLPVDYARIQFAPVQYDEKLMAIPTPVALDFVSEQKVIATNSDPQLLSTFRPQEEDFLLADTIDNEGEITLVGIETKGRAHHLFPLSQAKPWFLRYHERISAR